jgi:hypothetical protein
MCEELGLPTAPVTLLEAAPSRFKQFPLEGLGLRVINRAGGVNSGSQEGWVVIVEGSSAKALRTL